MFWFKGCLRGCVLVCRAVWFKGCFGLRGVLRGYMLRSGDGKRRRHFLWKRH